VPHQQREPGRDGALEEVQAAELAAALGCLDARDERGDDERRERLPGEQQRGDREGVLGVVEDGERKRDETEPAAEAVDRVGEEDPAQSV
jgi:hypothetical protein